MLTLTEKYEQQILDYHQSDDFLNEYFAPMFENFYNHGEQMLQERLNTIQVENFNSEISSHEFTLFCGYLEDRADDYITEFSNYYVGRHCIMSQAFGEQEDEAPGYTVEDELDQLILSGGYLYHDMSSEGVCIKLTDEELVEIFNELRAN